MSSSPKEWVFKPESSKIHARIEGAGVTFKRLKNESDGYLLAQAQNMQRELVSLRQQISDMLDDPSVVNVYKTYFDNDDLDRIDTILKNTKEPVGS